MGAPRLTVLLSLWTGWRPFYDVSHVRALAAQLRAQVAQPIRIALLTDQALTAERAGVDVVAPVPPQSPLCPEVTHRPNCYRRIRFFDPAWASQFGTEWIASLDLDMLVLGPMDPLIDYALESPCGFSIIRSRFDEERRAQRYNGAFFALKVGAQRQVWDEFDWATSPAECAATGWIGSDQVWMALRAPGARVLDAEQGIYFFEQHRALGSPPAVLVAFSNIVKPWSKTAKREVPEYFEAYQRFAHA